jgi:hypothetical protein
VQVDSDLDARTRIIRESRTNQLRATMGGSRGELVATLKCPYRYCDTVQSDEEPFEVVCNGCYEAGYCSVQCLMSDSYFHSRFCVPKPDRRPNKTVKKESSIAASPLCANCGTTVPPAGQSFTRCQGCSKVNFCSSFCSNFALEKGYHRKACPSGTRRLHCNIERTSFEETEHPGKCILCLNPFKCSEGSHAGWSLYLQGRQVLLSMLVVSLKTGPNVKTSRCISIMSILPSKVDSCLGVNLFI